MKLGVVSSRRGKWGDVQKEVTLQKSGLSFSSSDFSFAPLKPFVQPFLSEEPREFAFRFSLLYSVFHRAESLCIFHSVCSPLNIIPVSLRLQIC